MTKVKVKSKPKLKVLSHSSHLYFLSVSARLHNVIFVVVGVCYSSCTNESVLPSQHDNLPVPILFAPGWGGTMWVKSLAQGLKHNEFASWVELTTL